MMLGNHDKTNGLDMKNLNAVLVLLMQYLSGIAHLVQLLPQPGEFDSDEDNVSQTGSSIFCGAISG